MQDTSTTADFAARKLVDAVCATVQRGMNTHDVAVSAYVQAILTQATVQAIVDMLKHKNIISAPELDRALADAYTMATEQAYAAGRIAVLPAQSLRSS